MGVETGRKSGRASQWYGHASMSGVFDSGDPPEGDPFEGFSVQQSVDLGTLKLPDLTG
jgi:hypothetical protein